MVGSQILGDYYQLPKEGVAIISMLSKGISIDAIKASAARDFSDAVDVDEFIATLLDIGFISASGLPAPDVPANANFHDADRRFRFSLRPETARRFISPPAIMLYAGLIACAAWTMATDARTRPNLHAFYLQQNLTLTLLSLLLLQTGATILHECGHMIAAASQGISSRLGIGNRLWNIVAEADLSGIFSLPKRRRYFPLAAGMLVDLLSISCITLIIAYLARNDGAPAAIAILQALILQILITLSWQFNVFLRTDLYFIICNMVSYPTLDSDARIYMAQKMFSLSGGVIGRQATAHIFQRKGAVRLFSGIWIAGRIASIAVLFGIILPTMLRYLNDAYQAVNGTGTGTHETLDVVAFALLSMFLSGIGLYVWIANKVNSAKERNNGKSLA